VVDPNVSQVGMMLFGTDDPRVALVASYPFHPITRGFTLNTLFPIAGSMTWHEQDRWEVEPLLQTLSNTWSETGEAKGQITFEDGVDIAGPLTIGAALTRPMPKPANDASAGATDEAAQKAPPPMQRVVVIADGDFVSNGFLGLGGNLQLGINIINWLSTDDEFVAIPARTSPDTTLQLSPAAMLSISVGFLFVLPLILLGTGIAVWYRRRRR
jgi:ABC-type uncharacterized transport system involved in gliding motility auxiliary subunit